MNIYDIIKQKYPSGTQNNSRSIILRKIERFQEYPSERLANELERLTGVAPDFSNEDSGERLGVE